MKLHKKVARLYADDRIDYYFIYTRNKIITERIRNDNTMKN